MIVTPGNRGTRFGLQACPRCSFAFRPRVMRPFLPGISISFDELRFEVLPAVIGKFMPGDVLRLTLMKLRR
jgi:hypothetical protein